MGRHCPDTPKRIRRDQMSYGVKTTPRFRMSPAIRRAGKLTIICVRGCGFAPEAKMVGNFGAGLGRHVRRICEERLQVFGRGVSGTAFKGLKESADLSTAPIFCAIAAVIHWFSHTSSSQPDARPLL